MMVRKQPQTHIVGTYINCDLRYFPLKALGGGFDVVLIDPPWYMKSAILVVLGEFEGENVSQMNTP